MIPQWRDPRHHSSVSVVMIHRTSEKIICNPHMRKHYLASASSLQSTFECGGAQRELFNAVWCDWEQQKDVFCAKMVEVGFEPTHVYT